MKRIVIVGAGYAGVLTAKHLAKSLKKFKKQDEFEVTIIDKHKFHTMLTELHEVAACRVEEESIKISLDKVFAGRAVNIVTDYVNEIDVEGKVIKGQKSEYPYDYVVVAAGSKPTFFNVKGAVENTFTLWSYEDAIKLREHIQNMFRKAVSELDERKKKELLTFYVVGAGFTGVEMMGELAEYVPVLCDRFEIDPKMVSLIEVDLLERVCTILPNKQSAKVARRLNKMGVNLMLKTDISEVGADYIVYKHNNQEHTVKTNTVIWTAGIESADLSRGLESLPQAGRGRIVTDEYLRSIANPSVYVAGDNIYFTAEGEKAPVPQMVENAEASAKTVAHNLLADALGSGQPQKYAPKFHGVMVCVGGRYGACYLGLPGRFFSLPSPFAMLAKHFVNLLYFLEVLGWNKIFSYLNHEFFQVRNRRSFVGGHLSNRSATFFLVPLRMYLGFYWLREGIIKIQEGWLTGPRLTPFFSGANQFYENILNGPVGAAAADATTAAVDATTAATVAGGSAAGGTVWLNWNIMGLARVILVDGGELAFKLQVGLMDWIMETFVMYSSPVQNTMQFVIVVSEILVGLALLGGLFTTISGVYSIILQFMFITSTGIYFSTWWMLFAGVAMMFGAGRVISLDYYVMPFLKNWWKKIKPVKRWYLYND
ncbi:MAG: NAD(P)/FAD-dependent oxidoreductase [Clostridiales bacterium]|nr:NAD(P)/FAD-dependent oxidoreductase [Clostridiales bacterium]